MNFPNIETTTGFEPASNASINPESSRSLELPAAPLIVIEPAKAWAPLNLREIWAYRGLLYFLTWRDLKVRYKQTLLGVVWVVMQPLLTTLVFTVVLGKLARVPSDGIPYPVFVYTGMLAWTFFSGAVGSSSNSLVGNAQMITKVYFPRLIIPIAAIGGRLVDFGVAFIILIGLMVYYDIAVTWNLLLLPVLAVVIALLALGIGMWTSALNVKYRDVTVLLPVFLQVWMYASPVVYPTSLIPPEWRRIFMLNPLTGIIESFRAAVFGRGFSGRAFALSVAFTLVLLVYAAFSFRRMEKNFADII